MHEEDFFQPLMSIGSRRDTCSSPTPHHLVFPLFQNLHLLHSRLFQYHRHKPYHLPSSPKNVHQSIISLYSMSINLRSPFKQPPRNALRHKELRLWRRRRFKITPTTTPPTLAIRSHFISDFVSSFPSVVPALAFASGIGLYIYKVNKTDQIDDAVVKEWMLFTTPSLFTRFVLLRCPSLCFQAVEDVNEKLVKEDRHSGRFDCSGVYGASETLEILEYQRLCVPTDDGGVISLDFPVRLHLGEDDGLDTTLLLVPGSSEGSTHKNVQMFVSESLKRGCFPVVLNPRGCAGSPLTTPRMFTAADSDDVCKAAQFISKMRPRTTIMGVGWGYGANMLTKYLAEVGEKTSLTAATCIDNPFDLPEVPKTFQQNFTDLQFLNGLKNILRSNKEIFQGRMTGFEVEKALLAESVREFDSFISMVSCGCQTVEDFHSACSTHHAVKDIRVPVLFIQSDNETRPLLCAPHSLIAENPFTSLLLCSSLPSDLVNGSDPAVSRCHYLTIEWLAAVELGLLKGHHPLMEDNNVSLCRLGGRGLDEEGQESISSQQMSSAQFVEENSVLPDSVIENEGSAVENDKGQVLQTAQIVLNMLEGSMPGTFVPEQKEKVLTAVTQGATVLKALQDAVPEDAREKLTTTISEILSTSKNLKLDGLLNGGQKSIVLSDPKLGFLEKGKDKETSDVDGSSSPNTINGEHELGTTFLGNKLQSGANDVQHAGEGANGVHSQSIDDHIDQDAGSVPKGVVGAMDGVTDSCVKDKVEHSDDNDTPAYSDHEEKDNVNGEEARSLDSASGDKEPNVDQYQENEVHGTPQLASEEGNNTQNVEEKAKDSSADPYTIELPAETGRAVSSSKSDPVSDVRKEAKDISIQLVQDNTKADLSNNASPPINISEAFDALVGMDDSTQVAVNSVFGVIEDMITHLEEKTDNEKEIKNVQDVEGEKAHHAMNNNTDCEEKGDNVIQKNAEMIDSSTYDYSADSLESLHKIMSEKVDERIIQSSPQGDKDLSWSHGVRLGSKENNDQACSSNPSCTPPHRVTNLSERPLHDSEKHMFSSLQDTRVLDMNTPTSPCLDLFPEEGQWKLIEQPRISGDFDIFNGIPANGFAGMEKVIDNDLQPENTIIDTERPKKHVDGRGKKNDSHEDGESKNESVHDLDCLVKRIITDSIEAEILSRLSKSEMKELNHNLEKDLELVSNVIIQAVRETIIATNSSTGRCLDNDSSSRICGNLRAEHIVKEVSFTVRKTHYLRRILPIGVIVGSSLAALKKHFNLIIGRDNSIPGETQGNCKLSSSIQMEGNVSEKNNGMDIFQASESQRLDASENIHAEKIDSQKDSVIAGAFTAAVGASALLMQDSYMDEEETETLTNSLPKNEYKDKEPEIPGTQNNLVASIADKAMSVAGPMVPMKENGAVDQERLVTMLTNLGQNGGILRLVGKAALLWGGVRGAMSLTHKLISFLHLSERPLFQRLIGFVGMIILLWSPVYIPLLPTLVRGWATKMPSKGAELSCIIGLYVAVTVLITLWGKRIRGYERPLQQYGLDFTLPKFKSFMTAYVGGALIILSTQYVNTVIGCASLSLATWPPLVSLTWLPEFGKFLLLIAKGTISATGVALVEELLFRSWLPAEISKEFGFHVGIIVAGFTFSLFQRSLSAIPGLWLLSLALSGMKERSQGSLSTPIGLRAGMMTTAYILQKVSFLTYHSKVPLWIRGTQPNQPFSGISGLAFCLLLAVYLYPRQPYNGMKAVRKIRE